MSGGEALDLALGLLRAPARRGLLVPRPLPSGMTTLLEVAGGSASAARDASAATGATSAELLEASRFFVQQILFHEGADAYRILGARPDATQARLLTHHRLLQRWLHPDRDGGLAWDSAFSARVNQAWSRLRTPQARSHYDAELAARRPATARYPTAAQATRRDPGALVSGHYVQPPPSSVRTVRGPLAVIVVTLACIGLLWLLQRDQAPAGDLPSARPLATGADSLRGRPHTQADRTYAAETSVAAPMPSATNPDTPPTATPAVSEPDAAPSRTDAAPPSARENDSALAVLANVQLSSLSTGKDAGQLPSVADASRADAPDIRAVPSHEAVESASAGTSQPHVAENPGLSPAPGSGPHAANASTAASASDPLQLLQQAEKTVAQAAIYLVSDGSRVPPIWNDFPTEVSAAEARAWLAMRLGDHRPMPMELIRPQWRLGSHDAGIDAGYRVASGRDAEEGRLRAEMTWREGRWLITRLVLEASP